MEINIPSFREISKSSFAPYSRILKMCFWAIPSSRGARGALEDGVAALRSSLFARLRLSPYAASLGREPDLPPSGRACFASLSRRRRGQPFAYPSTQRSLRSDKYIEFFMCNLLINISSRRLAVLNGYKRLERLFLLKKAIKYCFSAHYLSFLFSLGKPIFFDKTELLSTHLEDIRQK